MLPLGAKMVLIRDRLKGAPSRLPHFFRPRGWLATFPRRSTFPPLSFESQQYQRRRLAVVVPGERKREELRLRVHVLTGGTGGGQLAGWNHVTDADKAELAQLALPGVCFSFGANTPPGTRILVGGFPTEEQLLAAQADLQALIIPFAGLPASTRKLLLDGGWDRRGLNVHNIHHNAPMTAELAVALALAAAKQLLPADRMLRRGDWSARGIPADGDPDPMPQMLLEGSTALVLGHGAVGKRISRVMSALGMTVLATRQSAPPGSLREEDSVYIHASADMHALLPKANVLFVCVPEGASTVGLVGQKEIGLLPGGAVIVNCARGSVLDEDALFDGLQSGHLLGAGIDVWYKYPVDSITRTCTPVSAKHDFGSLQNIIMSPHRAGAVGCTHTETLRIRELARLCNAAFEGGVDSMPNRVCVGRGY